jgi:beta-glucosidase
MMTTDEKLAQMLQISQDAVTTAEVTQYSLGSVLSQGGSTPDNNTPAGWADMIDGYRRAGLASRLKIPILYGLDSVHGLGPVRGATVFPHNVGLGATRDPALIEEVGRVVAEESAGIGADFPFSPVLAVARDERWGRTYEAFGETPELASSLGAAMVRGMQFLADGRPSGILANVKHYVGDGGTAGGEDRGDTSGDEAALQALHLAPYRAAVAARAGSMMASYSSWQGVKMHGNRRMITDVLKGEIGFGGFMLSDFNACSEMTGFPSCLDAGVGMYMVSEQSASARVSALRSAFTGATRLARVDESVRRILAVKCELGLFERSATVDRALTAAVGSAAHRMVARRAARASLVLLKNTGSVLPLSKTATVALAGPSADNIGNQCGGWTIEWQGATGNDVPGGTSIRRAMEAAVGTSRVVYSASGSSSSGASVAVAVLGETPYSEWLGDRSDLTVPSDQVAVVQRLKDAGLKVVTVLVVGRPMILPAALQSASDAIVVAWLPGSEGAGVTDVLFGDYAPTGKLPHTWPRTMAQIPINQGDTTYDPLYPYGHGLSY